MTTTGSSGSGPLSFELTNDLAEIPALVEHLEGFCAQHGIGPDVVSVVNLALEEIVTNTTLMDEVACSRERGRNVLLIRKATGAGVHL